MKVWDVVKKLVAGKTDLISAACKDEGWTLEPPTLYKYQEPYGGTFSGAPSCVDRTNRLIKAAKKIGNPYEAWSAPLQFLCQEHGHIAVRIPEKNTALKDIQQELFKTLKEFSDMMQASSEAMASGDVSRKEAAKIIAEGEEVLPQISAYLQMIRDLHAVGKGTTGRA